ncbi:MAG: MFS transporter [Dehalococcoidia bacterium]|nr:MFS transporter [Dehalococcoidia bacterium]MCA9855897.1 MFS transporter [Dehalococcoidia bacterium]MCB9491498.1 MFS transporter [Dehalococcoidia bacterium]
MILRPIARAISTLREQEQLLMISISTVLVMAGQGVISPVLPLFAKNLGVGAAVIGLTLSFFALARLILNVPLGVLSDRYGRRLLLVSGPLVTAAGMYGSGFAADIYQLLAWRFLAGAGSAMYMTGAQIYLADISTPATRARFIGTNQGALLLGVAVGPAIGGVVAEFWGLRAPFVLVGTMALVATVYAYLRLPETKHLQPPPPPKPVPVPGAKKERRDWVVFIMSKDFMAVSFITLAIFFTRTASRQTVIPLMAVDDLGFSEGSLGLLFTAVAALNTVLIAPSAVIADKWGRKAAIVPSGIFVALSLVLIGVSTTTLIFVVGNLALGIATAMAGPAPAAYAADISPPHLRGLGMGLYRSSGDIGFMVGPPLLGWIADSTSYDFALYVNAALIGIAAVVFLTARETLERPSTPAEATAGASPVPVASDRVPDREPSSGG